MSCFLQCIGFHVPHRSGASRRSVNSSLCLQEHTSLSRERPPNAWVQPSLLHSVPCTGKPQGAIKASSLHVTLTGRLKFPTCHVFREHTSVSLEDLGKDVFPSHTPESLHSLNAISLSETVSFQWPWITNELLGFLKHIAGRLTCPRPRVGIKSMSGFTLFHQIQPHDKTF